MITILTSEQIQNTRHFHVGECTRTVGARGGIKDNVTAVRRYSGTKYGKGENADQFSITTKHGLSSYFYITNNNVMDVHAWDDCPIGLPMNLQPKATLADLVANCKHRKNVDNPTWDTDYFD